MKGTQALGAWHKMLTAIAPQGVAMTSPSFLLGHGQVTNRAASSQPRQGSHGLPWSRTGAFCLQSLVIKSSSSPDKTMLLLAVQCQHLAGHQCPRERHQHGNCSLRSTQAALLLLPAGPALCSL